MDENVSQVQHTKAAPFRGRASADGMIMSTQSKSRASAKRGGQRASARNSAELENALNECRDAARRGYAIAQTSLEQSEAAIDTATAAIRERIDAGGTGRVKTSSVASQLDAQLVVVISELGELQEASRRTLEARRAELDEFSITLFGRTVAGKSTLMEILTRGDGRSIGQGGHRTTRDVRAYTWRGLRITDVPGVAAFEGAEDEALAFDAASKADLVLFLITDDSPQAAEAECFAQVRALGKPVVGVCNAKLTLNDADDVRRFLKKKDALLDRRRLGAIWRQFHEFADQHIAGNRIRFVGTHLQSRFLSDAPEYAKFSVALRDSSRFDLVEEVIIGEVLGRGRFLRVKSFIDGAVSPMLDVSSRLLDFSAQNATSGRVLLEKRRKLQRWAERFLKTAQSRIDACSERCAARIREEIPGFVERNFERDDAGKRWAAVLNSLQLKDQVTKLQGELAAECQKELEEIAREIAVELRLTTSFAADKQIKMDAIFDGKRAWNWGTTILSGALGIAALFSSGPPGWIAMAVGGLGWLVGLFLDDRDEKAGKQRRKLSARLEQNADKIRKSVRREMRSWLTNELVRNQSDVVLGDLQTVISGLFGLADTQRALAWTMNRQAKALHRTLVNEALAHLDASALAARIIDIARVPGHATMLVIERETTMPQEVRKGLERLLDERIWFVIKTEDAQSMLSQAIGRDCPRSKIRLEEKIRVAHVPLDELDAVGKARVRLAQQLTEYHVMK